MKPWLLGVIGVVWLLAVGVGLGTMFHYQTAAGAPGRPPSVWPANSRIPRVAGLSTVVLVAHPQCPCTRASIGELALLMARLHGQATAIVVFVRFPGFPEKWEETDLWQSAQSIPGVSVLSDPDGREAALFQAEASGQTMLYGAEGKLQFSGGITGSRGHSGDNAGRDRNRFTRDCRNLRGPGDICLRLFLA
jgi:hypothetical protein